MPARCNLVIDAGNTRLKVGLFHSGELVWTDLLQDYSQLSELSLPSEYAVSGVIVSSVGVEPRRILAQLDTTVPTHVLGSSSHLPFANHYSTPETLGTDRIAAVAGAYYAFPDTHCLVVDAGTALTCDVLHASKGYLGGTISPGLSLRFQALHQHTARLPSVDAQGDVPLWGTSTADCIRAGVVRSIVSEIDTFAEQLAGQIGSVHVLLTGGDALLLHGKLVCRNFVHPNLVLHGLNGLLELQCKGHYNTL